jgi:tight adherence protein C
MNDTLTPEWLLTLLAASVVFGLGGAWYFGRDSELTQRLEDLRGPRDLLARRRFQRGRASSRATLSTWLSQLGSKLLPNSEAARAHLVERFMHAGIYAPAGPSVYTSVRFVAGVGLPLVVLLAGQVALIDVTLSLLIAPVCCILGYSGPSVWLASRVSRRQRELRKSLPDFLDLMGACVQAGQSFESALSRVTDELRKAHPDLSFELLIVQREMTFGSPAARALRAFAERSGLETVRQLSTLVNQSQRFGSRITDSLQIHAEMLRTQRAQQAEAMAHKAAVKILLPTLLFIFPPVLVILAGPAAIDLHEKLVQQTAQSTVQMSPGGRR